MTTTAALQRPPTTRRQIRNRLLVSVAVLLVSAIGLTYVGQSILGSAIEQAGEGNLRTNGMGEAGERLHLALVRQETLVLAHAVERDEATVEAFEAASEAETLAYFDLAALAADDEEVATAVHEVRELATEWRETWAEPYLRLPPGVASPLSFNDGEALFAPVEAALTELNTVTESRRASAEAELAAVVSSMNGFFIPVVIVMSVFIAGAGIWLARSISGPLGRLSQTAQALTAGEEVTFTSEREDEIGALADVLERMRVEAATRYAATRVQADVAATFNRLSELTSFAHDEASLVDAAVRVLRRIAPAPRGSVMLLNNSTNRLIVAAAWGADAPAVGSPAGVERIESCPGIRRATAYVASDLADALAVRCPVHQADVGTLACLPMPALGSTVGVIHLEHPQVNAFDADTVASAARTAEQVAMAIANARLMKTMEGLANTDPLTGLRNARYFDAQLEQELAIAERDEKPMAVVMLDVDHFKDFNDTYGHPAGDEALRALARTLRGAVRDRDVVARYGGEEFIVAMPETGLDEARTAADKVRLAVEQNAFEIGPGRFGRITVSLGVSATDAHPVDQKGLVALSDAALYRAKKGGRNRVATPPISTAELNRAARRRRSDLAHLEADAAEPIMAAVPNGRSRRAPRRSARTASHRGNGQG